MSNRWIKITSLIAFIIAIVVMSISLLAIVFGIMLSGGINEMLQGSLDYAEPDNPGGGWLALGGIFGSIIGGFAAAMLAGMGLIGVIAVVVLGTPILIGWIVWKKTGNRKAYTICFIIPMALISLYLLISYLSSFLGDLSFVSVNYNLISTYLFK